MTNDRAVAGRGFTPADDTLERLDPLSAATARPVTTGAAILALSVPIFAVISRSYEIVQPAWLVVSIGALSGAVWLMLYRSRLARPLSRTPFAQLTQLLLFVMSLASVLSTLGANRMLRDDWAPMVVGIMLIALTPYRPAREIALWAGVHTLVAAVLGMWQEPWAVTAVPTLTFAVTASLPVAVMGFAAAAYAWSLNRSIVSWQARAWAAAEQAARRQRGGVARSVQQQRITTLNQEAVPFLARVVDATELTDADRAYARRLADEIRTLLVATIDRGWADTFLDDLVVRHPRLGIEVRVDDPDDVGRAASLEQRTLLRAIGELSIRRLSATGLDLRLRASDGRLRARWIITSPLSPRAAERELRGVIELMRGVTEHSVVTEQTGRLVLEFDYGHGRAPFLTGSTRHPR